MNNRLLITILVLVSACSTSPETTNTLKTFDEPIGHSPGCKVSDYPPAETSDYILPYTVGEEYTISQGNCGGITHVNGYESPDQDLRYSFDFDLPIGNKIIATRSGTVINTEDFYSNSTTKIEEINFIFIKHDDDTVAIYLHLSPKGSLVEIGDKVAQGDDIGIAGNSGFTGGSPHLHFDVRRDTPDCNLSGLDWTDPATHKFSGCKTIPVTFSNADPLDVPLLESKEYKAIMIKP